MSENIDAIFKFAHALIQGYLDNLFVRTREHRVGSGFETEVNSTFSSLIARQTALAIGLAESPQSWNPHIAPLILRSMIECLITVRWIRLDPINRASEFINFGLGAEKLLAHHYQQALADETDATVRERVELIAELSMAWIEGQRFQQFVEVNLGSWAGQSVRKMAQDSDSEDLYNFAYVPFSANVHNQWNHIGKFNAIQCDNPMHKMHYLGCIVEVDFVVDFVYRSTKYLQLTLDEFDEFYEFDFQQKLPFEIFQDALDQLPESNEGTQEPPKSV